jgi:prepilin signal peptidase PulO-like enzyme (type II secretory pathway)
LNVSHELILQGIALAVAIIGAIIDIRTTKIPNVLTFPATLVGWILNGVFFGWMGLGNAVLGAVVGALMLIIASGGRKIGGGDAKMLMAMGAFLGWANVLMVAFWFAIVWGVVSVIHIGRAIPWKKLSTGVMAAQAGGNVFSDEDAQKINTIRKRPIPVGPCLALGVLLGELLGKATLQFMGFA